jgi:hypothetical protein
MKANATSTINPVTLTLASGARLTDSLIRALLFVRRQAVLGVWLIFSILLAPLLLISLILSPMFQVKKLRHTARRLAVEGAVN